MPNKGPLYGVNSAAFTGEQMTMGDESVTRLMGNQREVSVERALGELRSGRPVVLREGHSRYLVIGAESIDDDTLSAITEAAGSAPWLVLSQPRLRSLGSDLASPGIVMIDDHLNAAGIQNLIVQTGAYLNGHVPRPASAADKAALDVVRLAYLLPAAIVAELPAGRLANGPFVEIDEVSLDNYQRNVVNTPRVVSRAPVPLEGIGDSEFVVFRGGEGMRDQVAVIIGKPDPAEPVSVRLHSACLTGDLFASLKCDCGDQLRGSARFMAENGGGVILYLDQEGRGNGIANKIRAYRLQHAGYSTYDADEILGFGLDQRGFEFAAAMLKELGFTAIKLLTNNPVKVDSLQQAGLTVSSQRAKARLNLHNMAYLAAKRDRAGHIIEDELD
jgi:GTP cyclohydrolase II